MDGNKARITPKSKLAILYNLKKASVRNVYRRWAPVYDATFGSLVKPYRRHIRTVVHECKARDILEVGVGTGMSLHHYPRDTKVTGVDICPEMLLKAQQRVNRGISAEVKLQLGDGESLAFPDDNFDLVVMLFVISVTPDPQTLLNEVARVLRPGGHVLIINHFAGVRGIGWIERLLAPMADHVGFHSQLPITDVLDHPEFSCIRITRLWPIGFFKLVLLRKDK
jgi:phosphatidylethanolamine/phosphatidyl-N-methylethanolamine N-methyltransferase